MNDRPLNYQFMIQLIDGWIKVLVAAWRAENYKLCRELSDLMKPVINECLKLKL